MTRYRHQLRTALALSIALVAQAVLLAPYPVLAQQAVRVAGQQIFQVNTGTNNMSANKRAESIQTNLDNALVAAKDKGTPVNIIYVNGLPVITLAGYQVCTVNGADAKQAGTTPALLAQKWANSLRNALADRQSVASYIAQLTGSEGGLSAPPPYLRATNQPMDDGSIPGPASSNAPGGPSYNPNYRRQVPSGRAAFNSYSPAYTYNGSPGNTPPQYAGGTNGWGPGYRQQGHVVYAPAGLVIPITLKTSISTQVAKSGDIVEAEISQTMLLGEGMIPAGSQVLGTITDAKTGGRLSQSGRLGIKFNSIRTPDGTIILISAHLTGDIGKYEQKEASEDGTTIHGEGGKAKLGQALIRGGVGAGGGAALGTAIGAIAGGGAGRGAWSGAAIGGGLGLADMALRKGRDVALPSGTSMKIQLDAPAAIAGSNDVQTGNL